MFVLVTLMLWVLRANSKSDWIILCDVDLRAAFRIAHVRVKIDANLAKGLMRGWFINEGTINDIRQTQLHNGCFVFEDLLPFCWMSDKQVHSWVLYRCNRVLSASKSGDQRKGWRSTKLSVTWHADDGKHKQGAVSRWSGLSHALSLLMFSCLSWALVKWSLTTCQVYDNKLCVKLKINSSRAVARILKILTSKALALPRCAPEWITVIGGTEKILRTWPSVFSMVGVGMSSRYHQGATSANVTIDINIDSNAKIHLKFNDVKILKMSVW